MLRPSLLPPGTARRAAQCGYFMAPPTAHRTDAAGEWPGFGWPGRESSGGRLHVACNLCAVSRRFAATKIASGLSKISDHFGNSRVCINAGKLRHRQRAPTVVAKRRHGLLRAARRPVTVGVGRYLAPCETSLAICSRNCAARAFGVTQNERNSIMSIMFSSASRTLSAA